MSTAPVFGFQSALGIDTANPTTVRFDFISSTLGVDEATFIDANGLRGTRSRDLSRVRQSPRLIDGDIVMQPNSVELSNLLRWILGGTPTGSGTVTYPLADTVPSRFVQIDKAIKVMTYNSVYVDTARFRGSQGEPMTLTLSCVGVDETIGNAGTFPATTIDVANGPWILADLALSVGGTTYFAHDVELVISNVLDRNRFYNSNTLTAVTAMDRHVTVNFSLPAGAPAPPGPAAGWRRGRRGGPGRGRLPRGRTHPPSIALAVLLWTAETCAQLAPTFSRIPSPAGRARPTPHGAAARDPGRRRPRGRRSPTRA
jgi:hypothetical protein